MDAKLKGDKLQEVEGKLKDSLKAAYIKNKDLQDQLRGVSTIEKDEYKKQMFDRLKHVGSLEKELEVLREKSRELEERLKNPGFHASSEEEESACEDDDLSD